MRFLRKTEYHDVATRLLREFHSCTHFEFTVLERSNGFLLSFILFSLSSLLLCRYSCRYYYYLSSLRAIFAPSSELERERETNFNYINDSIAGTRSSNDRWCTIWCFFLAIKRHDRIRPFITITKRRLFLPNDGADVSSGHDSFLFFLFFMLSSFS